MFILIFYILEAILGAWKWVFCSGEGQTVLVSEKRKVQWLFHAHINIYINLKAHIGCPTSTQDLQGLHINPNMCIALARLVQEAQQQHSTCKDNIGKKWKIWSGAASAAPVHMSQIRPLLLYILKVTRQRHPFICPTYTPPPGHTKGDASASPVHMSHIHPSSLTY